MTTTEPTTTETEERVVVIPEITVSVRSKQARERVLELVEKLRPELEELHAEALKVRADSDAALVALWPVLGDHDGGYLTDEMYELAEKATGWGEVWKACRWIGDRFGSGPGEDFGTVGLENHEVARGERDFPRGTIATVGRSDGGGEPIRVEVEVGPRDPRTEGGYWVREPETGKQFICTHDQIKEGLESVPTD